MKKTRLFIATLLVVVATTIAVVSCKKEAPETMLNSQPQVTKSYYPEGVDDMNAHLRDFKQRMKDSPYTRDNETLSLEEATWYLSSVANYDFANANVEFTDLRYDTLYYNINVSNGQVALADLNTLYQEIASDIDSFYQNLNLENKHFRFIGASVSNSGEVVVTLVITWLDHTWYFEDDWVAMMTCYDYFSEDSVYVWDGLGKRELQRVLNLIEGHNYEIIGENNHNRGYYIYTSEVEFNYDEYIDPYDSPFYIDSRLFAKQCNNNYFPVLNIEEMCYCLDSYLSLPLEYINSYPSHTYECPVHYTITSQTYAPGNYNNGAPHWYLRCHILTVKLGMYIAEGSSIDY